MASEKGDLARAGTMQVTAKDGKGFLDKNLTEWKKPYLMDHYDGEEEEEEEKPATTSKGGRKAKMSKHSTMKGTAKEANALLDEAGRPDEDALTRGQQKQIEEINSEKPAAKKGKMSKATTMVNTAKEAKLLLAGSKHDKDALTRSQQRKIEEIKAEKAPAKRGRVSKSSTMVSTAKEGKALIGSEKLSDTRQETKKRKGAPKRESTISKTMAEAKAVFGDLPASEGRSLRKRPAPPKAPLKKAGTMQKTAKEGKAFLKRGSKAKKAKKEEPVEEEEEEEEDEEESA